MCPLEAGPLFVLLQIIQVNSADVCRNLPHLHSSALESHFAGLLQGFG